MRKLLLLMSLFVAIHASAQPSFGIHGNLIGASMNHSSSNDETLEFITGDFKTRMSWKFGLTAQIPVSEQFVFMPQLNLLSKGGKIDRTIEGVEVSGDVKNTYLELPLNFVYNTGSFFIGAGPSISYGLSGEGDVVVEYLGTRDSQSFDVKFDGKKNADEDEPVLHYKALEFGANFIAGYKLSNGIFINAQYNLGLNNIHPDDGNESKNKYFGIGIGYYFCSK